MGPRTRGKGKWGSTGPGFRPEKVPMEKSSDRKKVPTEKVPTGKSSDRKKFRSGKSSDQEKVPTEKSSDREKVPTRAKGKRHRTRAIYSNIDKIENNSDSKGNSNRKE